MVRRFHRSIDDESMNSGHPWTTCTGLLLNHDNPLLPEDDDTGIVCQYVHIQNAEVTDMMIK